MDKIISRERRYYYKFRCRKCKFLNDGYTKSDSKAGLVLENFGMDCEKCGEITKTNLKIKYFRTVVKGIN